MLGNRKQYCEILEVSENADIKEIKKAYRKLALIHHPDKSSANTEEAKKKFPAINEAYKQLMLASAHYNTDSQNRSKSQDDVSSFLFNLEYKCKSFSEFETYMQRLSLEKLEFFNNRMFLQPYYKLYRAFKDNHKDKTNAIIFLIHSRLRQRGEWLAELIADTNNHIDFYQLCHDKITLECKLISESANLCKQVLIRNNYKLKNYPLNEKTIKLFFDQNYEDMLIPIILVNQYKTSVKDNSKFTFEQLFKLCKKLDHIGQLAKIYSPQELDYLTKLSPIISSYILINQCFKNNPDPSIPAWTIALLKRWDLLLELINTEAILNPYYSPGTPDPTQKAITLADLLLSEKQIELLNIISNKYTYLVNSHNLNTSLLMPYFQPVLAFYNNSPDCGNLPALKKPKIAHSQNSLGM